jgi:cytochrome c-type biogenesis protein CcmH/NrfG
LARGTQHLKKRTPAAQPRRTRADESALRAQQRRERKAAEAGMFFPKLRTHAKWVFVLLALVFAGGFVLFGVGSGSNGIGNVLQDWLNIGQTSSGPSLSSLEKKTREHPKDAQAWSDLADEYAAKQRTEDAIGALQKLVALRPRDADALQQLVGQYQLQLSDISTEAQTAQGAAPVTDTSTFQPPASSPFGKAFADPSALQDPLQQTISTQLSNRLLELQTRYATIEQKVLTADKKLVAIDPTDPNAQYQLATAADSLGDTATAEGAYRTFLKLSPDDPLAAQVKQRLKQLSG